MGRIESYFIRYNEDVSLEDRHNLFKKLYNKILHKDDTWHFFYEGTFDELRFHSKFKRRVEKFLEKDDRVKNYTLKEFGWSDDQKIVEEYKDYFTGIFHQNSLIALQLGEEVDVTNRKLERIIDRTVHSFFNMLHPRFNEATLEVDVMKDYLVDRAFYLGMTYQATKEKTNE